MLNPADASRVADRWQFWIDRGGTFTDVVARRPDGQLVVHKLLSENRERYRDAAVQAIRDLMAVPTDKPLPAKQIAVVKMGTTVATNALLERKGEPTVLVITKGFRDALRIAYQNRPQIFARRIILPEMLYSRVVEVTERYSAHGEKLVPLDRDEARMGLKQAFAEGFRACAIVFMHAYRYHDHEDEVAEIARQIGFTQISTSYRTSPLMRLVSRGDTTVADAYLSPVLKRYIDSLTQELNGARLMFMQSNGGLADARHFHGKDSILSGPAGGLVGAVKASAMAGLKKIISFDMGGTSTDVAHYDGELERTLETEIAGVRLRSPMMAIHTVAAGGGSILRFDGERYRVGPESAGADPGPACYRKGGPLTITDANVMVGKIQPELFPHVFGPCGSQPIDTEVVRLRFADLAAEIHFATGDTRCAEQVADGFLTVAIERMAAAIKKISVQRGHNVADYTLCSFGGAGGQHACAIAEALGISRIFIHPFAGVLSAYGMGLADLRVMRHVAMERPLRSAVAADLESAFVEMERQARRELIEQNVPAGSITVVRKAHIRYEGTDSPLAIEAGSIDEMAARFETAHRLRYGFAVPDRTLIVEIASVEAIGAPAQATEQRLTRTRMEPATPALTREIYTRGRWRTAPVYYRDSLVPGDRLDGPAIIAEPTGTNVVEPGWQAELTELGHLVLSYPERSSDAGTLQESAETHLSHLNGPQKSGDKATPDPVKLELFNNLFMSIAEQMGVTLQNTSYSVNIKERLDFSCAVFDSDGNLVANAPHIPVHLGSMGESVKTIIASRRQTMRAGDVYVLNNPYNGGTHLPDVTVITPVFDQAGNDVLFFVASRGHHADIGGITPGSMPPHSRTIDEEGILIDDFLIVDKGRFREKEFLAVLSGGKYPCRNPAQNIADLKAQIAANQRGVAELRKMVRQFGLKTVKDYMLFVQHNAESSVRRVIDTLSEGSFACELDDGSTIKASVSIDRSARSARIDFSGTTSQQANNFNAPSAVCKAAVLYVFRTLVDDDIPLNAGCLIPLDIVIPTGCMLNPQHPAAVVAGNVETSQAITDVLFAALGAQAASQGTMNNFTFGNERYQYYETICGGSGAGPDFAGADAVHTHMTNSRLTDPEVLEWRFPVLVDSFAIRSGSGGAGRHRGGDGVVRRIRFLEPMTAAILSSRRVVPPFGLNGGKPAAAGGNRVERADGRIEHLPAAAVVKMAAGDVFVIETPGGGGYGPPE